MTDIRNMQSINSHNNSLTNSYQNEPAATDLATWQAIEILDAKSEKADIPAIIQENCTKPKSHQTTKVTQVASRI